MSWWRALSLVVCTLALLDVYVASAEEEEGGYPLVYYGAAPYAPVAHAPLVVGGGYGGVLAAQKQRAAKAYAKQQALRSIASNNHDRGAAEKHKLASDKLHARQVLAKDLALASDHGYHRKKRTTIFKRFSYILLIGW